MGFDFASRELLRNSKQLLAMLLRRGILASQAMRLLMFSICPERPIPRTRSYAALDFYQKHAPLLQGRQCEIEGFVIVSVMVMIFDVSSVSCT